MKRGVTFVGAAAEAADAFPVGIQGVIAAQGMQRSVRADAFSIPANRILTLRPDGSTTSNRGLPWRLRRLTGVDRAPDVICGNRLSTGSIVALLKETGMRESAAVGATSAAAGSASALGATSVAAGLGERSGRDKPRRIDYQCERGPDQAESGSSTAGESLRARRPRGAQSRSRRLDALMGAQRRGPKSRRGPQSPANPVCPALQRVINARPGPKARPDTPSIRLTGFSCRIQIVTTTLRSNGAWVAVRR